ncbi:hypothetical protein RHSIM_Rhsim06G0012200 [Rhododendron simsii]|uniref:Syringolide-induced protein 14-1-1 n=1 Tax=Rhododendron simsii TaxID=118357 RepID=A0A834GSV2_RHOSS|nr:hypothetical protein RHSIM_Rhsim06G0012200 [Rhododendron simsii]
MEKPKSRNKFLKFLPRAASAVRFQNPPFSPDKLKHLTGKGFSGQFMSIIPAEARGKPKNSTTTTFEVQEPTSPKVSCMGQIKHKKKIKNEKPTVQPKDHVKSVSAQFEEKKNTTTSFQKKLSSSMKPQGRKSDASFDQTRLPDRAPSLSQMRRFASGRDAIREFDWGDQVKATDEDFGDYYSGEESEGEEREDFVPFSAPILVGGGGGVVAMEPRKEINLWKRRTLARPSPLQVKTMVRQ